MADKIVILNGGLVEQIGRPLDLYNHPRNMFVAGFIGSPSMNFLTGTITELSSVSLDCGLKITLPCNCNARAKGLGKVILGVRPEALRVDGTGDGQVTVIVDAVERLGSETYNYAKTPNGESLALHASGDRAANHDDTIQLTVSAASCHLFGEDGDSIMGPAG